MDVASLAPPQVEARVLFSALAGRQEEIDRFLGVLSGSVPMGDYFSPQPARRHRPARVRQGGARTDQVADAAGCLTASLQMHLANPRAGPDAVGNLQGAE